MTETTEIRCLFEHYEEQPEELRQVLKPYEEFEGGDYEVCEEMLKAVNKIGYTFDYGLDGCPFDLRKI